MAGRSNNISYSSSEGTEGAEVEKTEGEYDPFDKLRVILSD